MLDEAALWRGRRFQFLRGNISHANSNPSALEPLIKNFEGSEEEAWVAAFNELVGINYVEEEATVTAQVVIGAQYELAVSAAREEFEAWGRERGKPVEWLPDLEPF